MSHVERLKVKVVRSFPHDPRAFTQGLLWQDGKLWESTGLYGESSLRRVKLETGEVEARVELPSSLFGEGLARVGDRLVQLTWQEGKALFWTFPALTRADERTYAGEGWGLCYDGERLLMSDGGDSLGLRDPHSFVETGRLAVTLDGRPLDRLNELECVGTDVYANVWTTDEIVRIDARSGRVTAVIDASGLLDEKEREAADVLNGIAYRPDSRHWLITGKNWPRLFEVELVPGS